MILSLYITLANFKGSPAKIHMRPKEEKLPLFDRLLEHIRPQNAISLKRQRLIIAFVVGSQVVSPTHGQMFCCISDAPMPALTLLCASPQGHSTLNRAQKLVTCGLGDKL